MLTYTFEETKDEIIIRKGIATRELMKEYAHGKEFTSYKELEKALYWRDKLPIITEHDHYGPLDGLQSAIGVAQLEPCPDRRGLTGVFRFRKDLIPAWLREKIRRREDIPLSTFQFVEVSSQGEQKDILFDHIAVLEKDIPRCPPTQCGIGVADAMKPDETPSEPVPEPVHEGQAKEKKETEPIEPVTDETTEAPSDALQEVETLKAELAAKTKDLEAKEAELTAKREPLEGFLMQRGISKDAVEAMKLKDLEIMAQTLQQQQTQGLPGTVPAPPPVHKTDAEILAEADEKASKTLVQKSQEEFKEW